MLAPQARPSFLKAALTAAGIASLGTLPLQLLSNQSVLIREDLHFGEAAQGLLVSAAFGIGALVSVAITRFGEVYGRRPLTLLAAACTLSCALGIALLAHHYLVLLLFVLIGGVGQAGLTTAANFSLSATVAPGRQGLGFGVKQSAPPAAALIAGLAVPAVGLVLGWRWTYLFLGLAAVVLLISATRIPRVPGTPATPSSPIDDSLAPVPETAPRPALLLTAAAMLTANGSAMALIAFLPQWAHLSGMPTATAGLFVAACSALAIAGRLFVGAAADRRNGRNLPVVTWQMAAGAVGLALLALGNVPVVVAGGLVAFALGWSWPGLLLFAVVRLGRDRPNSAAAYVQSGAFAGGALGPLVFGLIAGSAGYQAAWFTMAAGMALGAGLLMAARRLFIADLKLRPVPRPA
ncbi:MFS transporter [Kineosporia babensis]|uniref:MFS transporter n=1 Tax=Kineosporia babensis TaxID=499548 RepID=A0A9X1NJC0_9ACTN|nr:MFS transporter [Kineosporia babensis]